ncbi:MAG: DNA mismatch repair protein MutS [Candidatus Woesearchaeota archaeon]
MTSILDVPEHNLTPGMKQYRDIKKQNQDCLVMLRMGDFYEMFYEDAITASKALEITLTARGQGDKRAPLAGIPFHALETYLPKLVKKGFKVAIVEQLEDPKKAKGLVKRGLVRIVTPGTVIESSMLNETENNYVMALTSFGQTINHQTKECFSIAFCDLSTGEFFTKSLDNETDLFNEISRFKPAECILPFSLQVNLDLISKIKSQECFINPLEDYYFKTDKAKETLLQHFQNVNCFGLEERNISVSGALMKYLLDTQKNSLSHLKKINLASQNKMIIDSTTLKNLELTHNIRDQSSRGTLLSVLDQTCTPMGARLLKKWLKEPLLKRNVIEARLNSLEQLNVQIIVREELIDLLKKVYDLERLITRINYGNANPKDLLALRDSLEQLPLLKEKLNDITTSNQLKSNEANSNQANSNQATLGLLKQLSQISDLNETTLLLKNTIKDESPITIREGNIIKRNYNLELDQLQDIKRNSRKYLQELEEKEKVKTGITTLRLGFTRVFGYFIEITKKNIHLVPENYIRKQTTANSERYITEELKIEEEKILGAEEKINNLEYELFQDILRQVSAKTDEIQDAARKIAVLDVLTSLAKVAMDNNYVKPEFVDENIVQIQNGRHPVIEKIAERYITNDIFINNGEIMIITGSNMSGKSTVMRQTALITLMAQIGSFVPADKAILGITDRIFTRVGASDDLSSGQSTFMVEMQETASILHNATEKSLIILDEIGRGTSTFDGVSIAWSVAEHIYNKIKAKTMFATHYHVLNKLADKFDNIKNYNLAVKESKGEVIMLHKLISGASDQSHGVHVAKIAGMPLEVIERAKEIQLVLEKDDEMVRRIKAKKLEEQHSLNEF